MSRSCITLNLNLGVDLSAQFIKKMVSALLYTKSTTEFVSQPIFQDINGLAVKFFIQKDLSQEVQAELCETITARFFQDLF